MNEDRVSDLGQRFDEGFQRLEKILQSQMNLKEKSNSSGASTQQRASALPDYVEHSFGGVPIPKAPARDVAPGPRMGDMSGLVVTDIGEDGEDLLVTAS